MKFTSSNISALLPSLKMGKIRSIMLYGPDKGVIDHIYSLIVKTLEKTSYNHNYNDMICSGIDITLNNISLFGGSDIIKITEVPSSINTDLKDILLSGTHHTAILIADELSPSSSLRKLFESEESFAAIACYNDDAKNVKTLSYSKITSAGKTINTDALNYLSYHLNGDRFIIENEINKLLLFSYDEKSITLEHVEKSISNSIISSPDLLSIAFAKGDGKKFFLESRNLLSENISVVWIIRALARYYINLYIVLNEKSSGISLENAISHLKPPIFFKYLQDFKDVVRSLSMERIRYILSLLHDAEISSKSATICPESICEELFFKAHYATL